MLTDFQKAAQRVYTGGPEGLQPPVSGISEGLQPRTYLLKWASVRSHASFAAFSS
jgi:hypothetical protein